MDEAAKLDIALAKPVPNSQPLGPSLLVSSHTPRHTGLTGALEVLRPPREPLRVAEVPANLVSLG
jgi:hypothetical protein